MSKLKTLILCPVVLLGVGLATAQTDGLYATTDNNYRIEVNQDGTLVRTDRPAAMEYTLIVEYLDKMYQGKKFDRLQLAVEKSADGRIYIMDRSKPKTSS